MDIVSNASPLISFAGIGEIGVLQMLFPEGIIIPHAVWDEVMAGDPGKNDVIQAHTERWIHIEPISDSEYARLLEGKGLDRGEGEAVLRFTLVEEKIRKFSAQRMCYSGFDHWRSMHAKGSISELARYYVHHIGKESFYEVI